MRPFDSLLKNGGQMPLDTIGIVVAAVLVLIVLVSVLVKKNRI
jgi:hypothetical protein